MAKLCRIFLVLDTVVGMVVGDRIWATDVSFCLLYVPEVDTNITTNDHNACQKHFLEQSICVLAELFAGLRRTAVTGAYRYGEKITHFPLSFNFFRIFTTKSQFTLFEEGAHGKQWVAEWWSWPWLEHSTPKSSGSDITTLIACPLPGIYVLTANHKFSNLRWILKENEWKRALKMRNKLGRSFSFKIARCGIDKRKFVLSEAWLKLRKG